MISTVIVAISLLLGAVFTLAYWLNPALRRRVEAPKYVFLEQLSKYDQSLDRGVEQRPDASRQ